MNDWQRSKTGLGRMGDDKVGDDYSNEGIYANMDGELDLMERQRRGRGRRRRRPPGPAVGPMPPPPPPPIMFDENEEEDMMFDQDGGNYWINPTNTLDRYPADDNMRMMNENEGMMLAPGRRRRRGRNGREGRLRRRNGRRDMMMDEYDDDIDFFDDDDDEMMEYPGEYGIPPPTRSR